MKKTILLVVFFVLLCSFGLAKKSAPRNMFLRLGANPLKTNREYRLARIYEDYYDWDYWQVYYKNDFIYKAMHPGRVDSVFCYWYDEYEDIYYLNWWRYYEYNNQNLVTDYYQWLPHNQHLVHLHSINTYNLDNHLTEVRRRYELPLYPDVYFDNYRLIVGYNAQGMSHFDVMSASDYDFYCYRIVFTTDDQGRIARATITYPDSEGWCEEYILVITYHPNDTTTMESYIEGFTSTFSEPIRFLEGSMPEISFGMVSQIMRYMRDYNDSSQWIPNYKTDYYYNTYDDLSQTIGSYYDSWDETWYQQDKEEYEYDINRNLVTRTHFWYDSQWHPEIRFRYDWNYYTHTEDVTSPASQLSCYPNPFRSELNIKLDNKVKGKAEVSVFNIKGQLVRRWQDVATKEILWDGKNMQQKSLPAGIYLLKVCQGKSVSTKKLIKL